MNSAPCSSPCGRALAAHSMLTSPDRVRRSPIHIRGLNRRHVAEHDFRRSVNEGEPVAADWFPDVSSRVLQDVGQNFSELFPRHSNRSFRCNEVSNGDRAWLTRILGSATR